MISVPGQIRIPYLWAAGPVAGRFLAGLREKELWGIRCSNCSKVICPPEARCPLCDGACREWIRVGPLGTLVTWSGLLGIIRLDGADTGLVHHVRGKLEPGLRLEPVFADQRRGHIQDILYFRPWNA